MLNQMWEAENWKFFTCTAAKFAQTLGPSLYGNSGLATAPSPLAPSDALPTLPFLYAGWIVHWGRLQMFCYVVLSFSGLFLGPGRLLQWSLQGQGIIKMADADFSRVIRAFTVLCNSPCAAFSGSNLIVNRWLRSSSDSMKVEDKWFACLMEQASSKFWQTGSYGGREEHMRQQSRQNLEEWESFPSYIKLDIALILALNLTREVVQLLVCQFW